MLCNLQEGEAFLFLLLLLLLSPTRFISWRRNGNDGGGVGPHYGRGGRASHSSERLREMTRKQGAFTGVPCAGRPSSHPRSWAMSKIDPTG